MPTLDQYLSGVGTNNGPQWYNGPNPLDPNTLAQLQAYTQRGGDPRVLNWAATGNQPLPSAQLPGYMNLRNVFAQINNLPREGDEDVPYDLMGKAGIPDPVAARLLATAAYARNESKAQPGWRPTTFQESGLENLFQQWLLANHLNNTEPNSYFPGYDMRAWFQAMQGGSPKATTQIGMNRGGPAVFFPSTFDTPYSLTFGPQSDVWNRQK